MAVTCDDVGHDNGDQAAYDADAPHDVCGMMATMVKTMAVMIMVTLTAMTLAMSAVTATL